MLWKIHFHCVWDWENQKVAGFFSGKSVQHNWHFIIFKDLNNLLLSVMQFFWPTNVISVFSILLKICAFLRSRSQDVRNTARETLEKIAVSLGARFLPFILKELKAVLTRGYQVIVISEILKSSSVYCKNYTLQQKNVVFFSV